jgi:hypothetical protein
MKPLNSNPSTSKGKKEKKDFKIHFHLDEIIVTNEIK